MVRRLDVEAADTYDPRARHQRLQLTGRHPPPRPRGGERGHRGQLHRLRNPTGKRPNSPDTPQQPGPPQALQRPDRRHSRRRARNLISGGAYKINLGQGGSPSGVVIQGNIIGLNASGTAVIPSNQSASGISLQNAANSTIGGGEVGGPQRRFRQRRHGRVHGPRRRGDGDRRNFIGTDITGTVDLGNGHGVSVSSANVTIGGSAAGAGNLISGNDGIGHRRTDGAPCNTVIQGNFIGTDVTGRSGCATRPADPPGREANVGALARATAT